MPTQTWCERNTLLSKLKVLFTVLESLCEGTAVEVERLYEHGGRNMLLQPKKVLA